MGSRWEPVRTEAFSDGVFAIAITLLVLDLGIPASEFDDLWGAILGEWPAHLAYATSFLTIGWIWLAHHAIFRRLLYVDSGVMRLNLLLLMAVSFLPFPTRLAAEAVDVTDAERAAVIFYGATLLVISLLISALWAVAARDRTLLRPEVTEEDVRAIVIAASPNIGLYVGLTVLAIFAPHIAAFGYLLVAILLVLRARGDSPAPSAAGAT